MRAAPIASSAPTGTSTLAEEARLGTQIKSVIMNTSGVRATFQFFAAYLWATVLYIAIALCVNRLMAWMEARCAIPGFIAAK